MVLSNIIITYAQVKNNFRNKNKKRTIFYVYAYLYNLNDENTKKSDTSNCYSVF